MCILRNGGTPEKISDDYYLGVYSRDVAIMAAVLIIEWNEVRDIGE